MEPQPKISRLGKGVQITKSAWHVLKLDKELAALPLISLVLTIIVMAALTVAGVFGSLAIAGTSSIDWKNGCRWLARSLLIYLMPPGQSLTCSPYRSLCSAKTTFTRWTPLSSR